MFILILVIEAIETQRLLQIKFRLKMYKKTAFLN